MEDDLHLDTKSEAEIRKIYIHRKTETDEFVSGRYLKLSFWLKLHLFEGFPGGSVIKNPPTNARITGLIPGLGRPPGERNGYPLQYSCLGNPMDTGAWWATVHRAAKKAGQDLRTKHKQHTSH